MYVRTGCALASQSLLVVVVQVLSTRKEEEEEERTRTTVRFLVVHEVFFHLNENDYCYYWWREMT